MSAEKKRIVKRSKTNSVMELVASRLGVITLLYDKITNSRADNKKLWQKNKK